ncbi:MAG: hypothetical protein IPK60_21095 [Sandaracinaceae bacterium]|nr:hypothetical protein [Sandaracinaceae bacterium]
MPTLEQRVQALESGELERLRGLAQRRLERLRQERAAVADLRERLELAHANADVLASQLAGAKVELLDTRSHLKDALEELAEANAKLAAPPPEEASALAVLRRLDADRCSVSVWPVFYVPTGDVEWRAQAGDLIATAASFHAALAVLAEKLQ